MDQRTGQENDRFFTVNQPFAGKVITLKKYRAD